MDAYNRGYFEGLAGLGGVGSTIGSATLLKQSSTVIDTPETDAGFYAAAYQLADGSIVISYRGTDQLTALPWDKFGSDIWNGYSLAVGSPEAKQAAMAIQFYKSVLASVTSQGGSPNIVVTGHSLGGGLAGLVGALYGLEGVLFDNMPFEAGANAAHTFSTQGEFVPDLEGGGEYLVNTDLRQLIYGSQEPWAIDRSALGAVHVDGEFLAALRLLQSTPSTPLEPGPGIDLPGIDSGIAGGNLHSISLLVLLQFAYSTPGVGTDWQAASKYIVPQLFDDEIASIVGVAALKGASDPDLNNVMRDAIAYSALDPESSDESKPFGDSAIRALFDDADELGRVVGADDANELLTDSLLNDGVSKGLAKIVVQYAGDLARSDAEGTEEKDGVLRLSEDGSELSADLDPEKWAATFNTGATAGGEERIVGLEDLVDGLRRKVVEVTSPVGDAINAAFDAYEAATSHDEQLYADVTWLAAAAGDTAVTLDAIEAADAHGGGHGASILIGGGGADTLTGGHGADLVLGGKGDDTFTASGPAARSRPYGTPSMLLREQQRRPLELQVV